ncbi:hypothetical protein [Deinococcus sp. AJ005]|uniref:hypothetical protein n=1 Tax=Deinococcus sp. AJ005 TaxID=2652443 RepID=UPI00125CB0AD|nr:hypothetical protein [Deinococcus sp. AJ005]QFP77597.1 hypothetical protein DAAJ005_14900 [Deinococcus sp. AJ005]
MSSAFEALIEWGINIFISTLPLWLGAILFSAFNNVNDNLKDTGVFTTFLKNVPETYQKGELFSYSAAGIAPIIYIIWKARNNKKTQGIFLIFGLLCIAIGVISSVFIGTDILNIRGNVEIIKQISISCFIMVFVMLLITFYLQNFYSPERRLEDSSKAIKQDTDTFVSLYLESRRSE